jgi:hypothetical protein
LPVTAIYSSKFFKRFFFEKNPKYFCQSGTWLWPLKHPWPGLSGLVEVFIASFSLEKEVLTSMSMPHRNNSIVAPSQPQYTKLGSRESHYAYFG